MKAYVYIKIKEHPRPEGGGYTKGDIVFIYPMVEDQGRLTLDSYVPVVMDLTIPCGKDFIPGQYNCMRCPNYDPDMCDVRKYTLGKWGAGDIENPPRLLRKALYTIDRSTFISGETETLVTKKEKTAEDKALIYQQAKSANNEQLKTIIQEKTILAEIR